MDTKLEVTNLITPIINSYNIFDIGVSEYLHDQTEKYYFTNTFIHRSDKVRFYDIYYPIKATYKALTTDFEDLQGIFEEYKKITIVGSAGSGKTTLIKHIFLHTIKTTNKIPILIELRNLNDYNGDFEKLICEKVVKTNLKPTDDIFKRTLQSGKFLFLLDGYDEIFSNRKQEINRQIDLFIDAYSNNNFLITTRPGSGVEGFPRFYDFKVDDLNNNDVEGFIEKIVEDKDRRNRIINIVADPKNRNYFEYLRNPLLLSMFIMAFENHPEIPKKKSSFYRNVFDTLYSKHDGITKGSWPREKLTKLERDDFEKILNIFSYLTLSEGQYTFTEEYLTDTFKKVKKSTDYNFDIQNLIYDLRTTISIMTLDGFEYSFPHRSLQEYFTAQFIGTLPTDKKEKAYNNLFRILEKSSTDPSFNLWSICNELDFIDFNIIFFYLN
jgi:predicted NACHT family NTPase